MERETRYKLFDVCPFATVERGETEQLRGQPDRVERRTERDRARKGHVLIFPGITEQADVQLAKTASRNMGRDLVDESRDLSHFGPVPIRRARNEGEQPPVLGDLHRRTASCRAERL